MRYLALCTDYDGTLATEGRVMPETFAALERLIASGRRIVLVTGRELDELRQVCPRLDRFEYVVAENGALLHHPATGAETPLAKRPPESFIAALRARGVGPVSVGRVIVATWEPHETAVLETIKEQGLELQVIFNKGAVMVLPAGVNKATGLAVALERMGLSRHNAVGIGDAQNDHALLALCECGVAVANALPTLKEAADFVTNADRGAGVTELMEAILRDDLASREPARHHVPLGWDSREQEVRIRPYGENLLLAGAPDAGQSALAAGLLERLASRDYTFCVIDPRGRFGTLPGAVSLGSEDHPPGTQEIIKLLRSPERNCTVNLAALTPAQRPAFFSSLMPRLAKLRAQTGHPHWLVIDEARSSWAVSDFSTSDDGTASGFHSVLQITEHPSLIAPSVLRAVDLLLATGNSAAEMIQEFCQATGTGAPHMDPVSLKAGEALAWRPRSRDAAPFRLRIKPVER